MIQKVRSMFANQRIRGNLPIFKFRRFVIFLYTHRRTLFPIFTLPLKGSQEESVSRWAVKPFALFVAVVSPLSAVLQRKISFFCPNACVCGINLVPLHPKWWFMYHQIRHFCTLMIRSYGKY